MDKKLSIEGDVAYIYPMAGYEVYGHPALQWVEYDGVILPYDDSMKSVLLNMGVVIVDEANKDVYVDEREKV
jgi:hypothetical protein